MEPLDTDLAYTRSEPRRAAPGSRFNALLIVPIAGLLLVLVFIGAAIFQWDLSGVVDSIIGLFLVLFVVSIALLFWAGASRSSEA